MKTLMILTLIALATLTTACIDDTHPKKVSSKGTKFVVTEEPEEMATVEETCKIADEFVSRFIIMPSHSALQEARNTMHEEPYYSKGIPESFWGPLLMRVYATENLAPEIYEEILESMKILAQTRNTLTLECHENGVRLTRQQVEAYYETGKSE